MNEPKATRIILCCVILANFLLIGWLQPLPVRADSEKTSSQNIGRSNPFGRITGGNKSTAQKTFAVSQSYQEKPELFIETVTLKFLDARDIERVAASMSSEHGMIVTNQQNNSLIICDTRENIAKILAEIEKVDKAQQQVMFVETVTLKFLEASNLKNALEKMLSKYGSIAVDNNTNSLIICDTKDNLGKILAEVEKANQTPLQIMIEVVIIDVQLKDDTEIGVDWDILSNEHYDIAYRQGMIYPNRLMSTKEDDDSIGNATAFMTRGLGGELSVINGDIRNVVNLLQERRDVEILASPRVLVVSGQQAEIKTVEEIPYQEKTDTSEGGSLTSTEFKEIGVTLGVKATLTDGKRILMEIKPSQSVNTGVSIADVPVVDTREADTTLLMEDGQIIVMGGLRRQETKVAKYQVPVLGDLPLVGLLFSNSKKIVENSELLVLISPHIYKGEPVPEDVMNKYKQLKNREMLSIRHEPKRRKLKQTGESSDKAQSSKAEEQSGR